MTVRHLLLSVFFLTLACSIFCQTGLTPVWDNGLKFKSPDGATSLQVGGRVHYDVSFINQSRALDSIAGPATDKLHVRRARLTFAGTLNNAVKYEAEFSFGEDIEYGDLYVAFLKLPFFEQLKVGHFREPFGMEENMSSNATVFMERSLTSAMALGRNAGMMVQKTLLAKRMRLYGGFFRFTNSLGADTVGESKHSVTGRIAYFPVWDSASNQTFHFGLSSNIHSPQKNTYGLNIENTTHTGDVYLKTGRVDDVLRVYNIGSELGYSLNRFTLQSEYMHSAARIRSNPGTDRLREFNAYYITGSYFLGGGERRYDQEQNTFSKISMSGNKTNAWEMAVRYAKIHLRESAGNINRLSDLSFGINWYYSENWRVMCNYIRSWIQEGYSASAFQMRLQATF